MLHEFSVAGLLITPMVICVGAAAFLTWITYVLIPQWAIQQWIWKRSWLGLSLFVFYIASALAFLDGGWK
ncbi:Protein of unknown function [Pseudomonas sp. 43mfcvi1.1]|uniref:DUF1656 domain-containing protein n=2 Tax=Pseudomonas TaxID=286 RepID=UPI00095380A7|nr:DUF1656 domain-containing protein [Pseudomonas syringae group genomosp. 3]MBM0212016.1 DUF1656 domain-containing protein [Pseudomonas syringae pv. maculicola]PWJ23564.1 uncharacterized protein DUF1656 [Pseudomonas sp. 43mfcvi1.1]SIR89978.1 Protein of unknown function [Pseudomonas sp. A214]SSC00084.1 Protein of unknown function [Pseudomonas sp. 43mfcvi1.1]